MSEAPAQEPDRSALDIGVFMTLAALGLAALLGVIAVLDAGSDAAAVSIGAGTATIVFFAGGTIACALACLVRGRVEILALGVLAASGLAIDLFVLAIWREIDDETYGKIAGIAFVWTFFGLLVLGLTLAVRVRHALARALYMGAIAATIAAGLISTWLIATTGGSITPTSTPFGVSESITDEILLRPLAVALVLIAALWFGALAASRLERAP